MDDGIVNHFSRFDDLCRNNMNKKFKADLKTLSVDDFYELIESSSEKFTTVYKALKWNKSHGWLKNKSDARKTIIELVEHSLEKIHKGEDSHISTGGIMVEICILEDSYIEMSVYADLGNEVKFT